MAIECCTPSYFDCCCKNACSSGKKSRDLDIGQDFGINYYYLEHVLPYFPSDLNKDSVLDFSESELLLGGHISFKYAADGIVDFHSIRLVTSNAKQMSKVFQFSFGFEEIAYKGLETGSQLIASHILRNENVTIELINNLVTETNPINDDIENKSTLNLNFDYDKLLLIKSITDYCNVMIAEEGQTDILSKVNLGSCVKCPQTNDLQPLINPEYIDFLKPISDHQFAQIEGSLIQDFLSKHCDGVIDVSFIVNDVSLSFAKAIVNGAKIIRPPTMISDKYGKVKIATIGVPNTDLLHTLIENVNYVGSYLPNYLNKNDHSAINFDLITQNKNHTDIPLSTIDHCVENYSWGQTANQSKFYANAFGFHKFWAVDEDDVSTVNSSLVSIVMASANGKVKLPLNEPAKGEMRGQIEEFNDYNHGPGIQHVAFKTKNIIATVRGLKARGVEFNVMGKYYYENLIQRMNTDGVKIKEDINELMELNILVDYTKLKTGTCNYILQIFTKPIHDRPTLFFEIIQRNHHNGFGKGTFKGLFESIEAQQILRGTLIPSQKNKNNSIKNG